MSILAPSRSKLHSWDLAPLPKFYDPVLARAVLQTGWYATFNDAYIDVTPERRQFVQQKTAVYRASHQRPNAWRIVQTRPDLMKR